MLSRQNLRRRHDSRLETSLCHFRRHQPGNHGFTRANVALQQAVHRMLRLQILQNLPGGAALRVGQRKRQLLNKLLDDRLIERDAPASQLGLFLLVKLRCQNHFKQFFKRQPLTTAGNFLVIFRCVEELDSFGAAD